MGSLPRKSFFYYSLIILCIFPACKKELKQKQLIYEDELQDTSQVEIRTSDTTGFSCSHRTPEFTVDLDDGLLKFRAVGYDGRAIAKFTLSDRIPEIKGLRNYSIKLHFEDELVPYNHRSGPGPIIRLAHDRVYRYDPTQEEVFDRRLEAPKSLTIHLDRALSNFKVMMDGDRNVSEFFVQKERESSGPVVLTVGTAGGSTRTGDCGESALQLDGIEVFER